MSSDAQILEKLDKMEKLFFDFANFMSNWVLIATQIDREKYIELVGPEKFEELKNAIASFITEISKLREGLA